MGDGPNDAGLTRTNLARALDASLRRLGIDTHRPLPGARLGPADPDRGDAALLRRRRARRQDPLRRRQQLPRLAAAEGGAADRVPRPRADRHAAAAVQPAARATSSSSSVDVCRNEGIGMLPWSPLAGGWLTGKYQRDETPTGATRLGENPNRGMEAYGRRNADERTWQVIEAVQQVAEVARRVDVAGRAGLAGRPAGHHVGDPRRPHARAARRQPRRRRPAPVRRRRPTLLTEASAPIVADYPYGGAGVNQRDRTL